MFALYQPTLFSSDFGVGLLASSHLKVRSCGTKIMNLIEMTKHKPKKFMFGRIKSVFL